MRRLGSRKGGGVNIVKLSAVKRKRQAQEATKLRDNMRTVIKTTREHLGNELAGYSIVAWDSRGAVVTSIINTPNSPVSAQILPMWVYSKLEAHVTEDNVIDILNRPYDTE
jgi:hypothetical protein